MNRRRERLQKFPPGVGSEHPPTNFESDFRVSFFRSEGRGPISRRRVKSPGTLGSVSPVSDQDELQHDRTAGVVTPLHRPRTAPYTVYDEITALLVDRGWVQGAARR